MCDGKCEDERPASGHGPDWRFAAGLDWRWWVRVIIGSTYLMAGAAYTFGPPWWHNSGNFYFINMIPVPFQVWSALLLVGGAMLMVDIYPYNWVTYFFLLIVSLFWGIGQLAAVVFSAFSPPPPLMLGADDPLHHVAGGGPFFMLGIAGFNLLFMMIGAREWGHVREKRKSGNA